MNRGPTTYILAPKQARQISTLCSLKKFLGPGEKQKSFQWQNGLFIGSPHAFIVFVLSVTIVYASGREKANV